MIFVYYFVTCYLILNIVFVVFPKADPLCFWSVFG